MIVLLAALAPASLPPLARQAVEAFFAYPQVVAPAACIALAAVLVAAFWLVRGAIRGAAGAGLALRAQTLRRQKDHRALIVFGVLEGLGGGRLRDLLIDGVADHFGGFAFQAPVQVEAFPVRLKTLPPKADKEARRRALQQAVDVLERTMADVIVWGRRRAFSGRVELRILAMPAAGRLPEEHVVKFRWKPSEGLDGLDEAVAYACARRARPVLNRPQDYKPEKLQPIVEALDRLVAHPPPSLSDAAMMEILSDCASGALSLGERGGETRWLEKSLLARRRFLDKIDRQQDPGAWGAAQQEVGRALAALGEREADRAKLEEAVGVLRISLDALRATDSLQHAEVAMRALTRAEQTLQQRQRIGLRWPV